MRESARSPQTAIVLASLSFSALFSVSQTGGRPRYNAYPTPSQLSCHWLHMRNNETSSETRLQKGGVQYKKNVLKEGGNCGIKRQRLLSLSVAIIFWEVWGSAFLASVSGAREDLGYYDRAFGCQIALTLFTTFFFSPLVPFYCF